MNVCVRESTCWREGEAREKGRGGGGSRQRDGEKGERREGEGGGREEETQSGSTKRKGIRDQGTQGEGRGLRPKVTG